MSAVRLNALVFVVCSALAVGVVWLGLRRPAPAPRLPRASALSAVPEGAILIATLDARKLLATRLGAALIGGGGELPGLGPIADVCGFDPTLELERLTFAVPSASNAERDTPIDFGLAGYGRFSSASVAGCASTLIQRRSGSPVTTKIGSFAAVRSRSGSYGELAVRDGGPVLLGGGHYLREMIDAADGRLPSASSDQRHKALRRSLGEDATLLATCILPRGWLERLVDDAAVARSPLSAIENAALRLDVGARVEATLALGCPTLTACADLKQSLGSLVESALEERLPGAKNRLRIDDANKQIRLTFWLEEAEAIALASSALKGL